MVLKSRAAQQSRKTVWATAPWPGAKPNQIPAPPPPQRRKLAAPKPQTKQFRQNPDLPPRTSSRQPLQPDELDKKLMSKSAVVASIRDPVNNTGIKIPQSEGEPTAVEQLDMLVDLTYNAGGIAGLRVVCPVINNATTDSPGGFNYQIINPDATVGNVRWGDGTTVGKALGFTNAAALRSTYRTIRVVSGQVAFNHELSTNNNTGEMTAGIISWGSTASNGNLYSSYKNFKGASTVPNNKNAGIVCRYLPAIEYKESAGPEHGTDSLSYEMFFSTDLSNNDDLPLYEMYVISRGPPNGTAQARIFFNFEGLARFNVNADVTPSYDDALEMQVVYNTADKIKASQSSKADLFATSKPSTFDQDASSSIGFLGDVLNVFAEGAKIAGPFLAAL